MSRAEFRARIRRNPEWFARSALRQSVWAKQVDIMQSVFKHRRTAVRGCVSSGKTHAAALAMFAWLFGWGPGSRVFTIAPSHRQVDTNLWGEARGHFNKTGTLLGGRMYQTAEYKLSDNWYAKGFSTKDPSMVHGIHGPHDLLIVDDAHGVPQAIYDEVENMMAGGDTHVCLLYNPVVLAGETYDCTHSKAHLYNNIRISWTDTPNAIAGKAIIKGIINPDQAKEWLKTYGPKSNFCLVKLFAEYPRQEPDTLIPLDWIEAAFQRWKDREEAILAEKEFSTKVFGVDVARFGDDKSSWAPLFDKYLFPIDTVQGHDTMRVAGETAQRLAEHDGSSAYVDVIGVGSGVVDRLAEQDLNVNGVNSSEASEEPESFTNLRSQMAWQMREALNPQHPEPLVMAPDSELQAQLSVIKYKIASKGQKQVEKKDEMRKRLGVSPDKADSAILAVHGRRELVGDSGDLIAVVNG